MVTTNKGDGVPEYPGVLAVKKIPQARITTSVPDKDENDHRYKGFRTKEE